MSKTESNQNSPVSNHMKTRRNQQQMVNSKHCQKVPEESIPYMNSLATLQQPKQPCALHPSHSYRQLEKQKKPVIASSSMARTRNGMALGILRWRDITIVNWVNGILLCTPVTRTVAHSNLLKENAGRAPWTAHKLRLIFRAGVHY